MVSINFPVMQTGIQKARLGGRTAEPGKGVERVQAKLQQLENQQAVKSYRESPEVNTGISQQKNPPGNLDLQPLQVTNFL